MIITKKNTQSVFLLVIIIILLLVKVSHLENSLATVWGSRTSHSLQWDGERLQRRLLKIQIVERYIVVAALYNGGQRRWHSCLTWAREAGADTSRVIVRNWSENPVRERNSCRWDLENQTNNLEKISNLPIWLCGGVFNANITLTEDEIEIRPQEQDVNRNKFCGTRQDQKSWVNYSKRLPIGIWTLIQSKAGPRSGPPPSCERQTWIAADTEGRFPPPISLSLGH